MFNLSKSNDVEKVIKEEFNQTTDTIKDNLQEIGAETKKAAGTVSDKVKQSVSETKDDASALLASIRELLIDKSEQEQSKANLLKETLAKQYNNLRAVAEDELTEVIAQSQVKSRKVLNDQPLLALAVAVGAGALIGYVIGQSKSSKD